MVAINMTWNDYFGVFSEEFNIFNPRFNPKENFGRSKQSRKKGEKNENSSFFKFQHQSTEIK